ncbi:hypothetical protein YIM73518_16700 [Thermus brockianus]
MTVERVGEGRFWEAHLESGRLVVGGLEVDLEGADPLGGRIYLYVDAEGAPTLEPTGWLGAEVVLPPRRYTTEVVEVLGPEGEVYPMSVQKLEPVNPELVAVRLFALPERGQGLYGGEA